MISKDITLRGLQIFEVVARTGSVAKTAQELGMSLPAVSQQLRNLEDSVGRSLLDHGRRPMLLTPAGTAFLKRTEDILRSLRRALTEASVLDLSHVPQLRLGVIDDFDNHVTPELAAALAGTLADCEFRLHIRPSHELCELARARMLDVVVAAAQVGGIEGLEEYPLLADPFMLIVPRGFALDRAEPMQSLSALPFLRYDRNQMIGQQIEAQLRRLNLNLPNRFELGSNPAITALVAHGSGWAVTTALSYLRSGQFHDRVEALPLPFEPFSRTISLFAAFDWITGAASELAGTLRRLLMSEVMPAMHEHLPWAAPQMRVLHPE
ncbi:LysR family transcriptional regulator [Frigidibacter sp. ROC022]|uniref:LysR family transcriptional regulator n=1 Tax=Frigidibacter sp. ROC022 TaxID=2971796 RepID=UPI00215A229E|nr:LysR family transcriptional regulator [Frigidibacter sp. ROC022]MCR8724186.1 LysR family transcriptional regulator [Frigidibacter sp. ROC022]